jgi:hypothetical protein
MHIENTKLLISLINYITIVICISLVHVALLRFLRIHIQLAVNLIKDPVKNSWLNCVYKGVVLLHVAIDYCVDESLIAEDEMFSRKLFLVLKTTLICVYCPKVLTETAYVIVSFGCIEMIILIMQESYKKRLINFRKSIS